MNPTSYLLVLWCSVIAFPGYSDGNFSTLSYNIAGLLEPISSSNPATNTKVISCKIRGFSIVNVQEDFNYHADLYDTCDDHPYRSPTSGGMGIGSGLNSLSYFPFQDFNRGRWDACNGVDCLTPKGWTSMRVQLEEGTFVSIYNLHAQAQTESPDLDARRKNILHLLRTIESQAGSDAVLVMGDTNTRYTREGDNIEEFLKHGFRDVWVDLIRQGQTPRRGDPALTSCTPRTSADCEVVDKVLYRNSRNLQLQPLSYRVDDTDFVNAAGQPLSDHYPIVVEWRFQTQASWLLSNTWGGPHGASFNDLGILAEGSRIQSLTLRSGERVDQIQALLSNGTSLSHGGNGGKARTQALAAHDEWTSGEFCSVAVNGHTRIGYAAFGSRLGQRLEGGKRSGSCVRYAAPYGYRISGFHGRSGDEIDQLGLIYSPISGFPETVLIYTQIINRATQLCLDINPQSIQAGADVQQWTCNGGDWQKWGYETSTGLLRNKENPKFCLDNGNTYTNGSALKIWPCTGNANQQFLLNLASGQLVQRTWPLQVLDGFGELPGADVILYQNWGGLNQSWDFRP